MASSQFLIITGHLGAEPEMRYTPSGSPVTNFSIAVNEKYEKNGEEIENKTWFRVTTWGTQAEVCKKYLSKGDLVQVTGKLVSDPETGGPRIWGEETPNANFDVKAQNVLFLVTKGGKKSTPYDEEEEEEDERPVRKTKKVVKTGSGKFAWMEK